MIKEDESRPATARNPMISNDLMGFSRVQMR